MNPLIDIRYFGTRIPVVCPLTDTISLRFVERFRDNEFKYIDRVTTGSVVALGACLCLQCIREITYPSPQVSEVMHVRMILADKRIPRIILYRPMVLQTRIAIVAHGIYRGIPIGFMNHEVQFKDGITTLECRIFRIVLAGAPTRLVIDNIYCIFGYDSTISVRSKNAFVFISFVCNRLIITHMNGIHTAEGIADEQVQRIGGVAAVNGLVCTVVDVLSEACFPFIIGCALAICFVSDEGSGRFGRAFYIQVPLIRETIIEELITIPHTDILIDGVVINTRHANGGL